MALASVTAAAAASLAGPARAAADLTEGLPSSSPVSVPTVDIDGAVGAAAGVIRVSESYSGGLK